jgi:hypothetical protein
VKAAMVAVVSLALVSVSACSGMRSHVRADKSNYPVSLSEQLRGADGKLLQPSQKKNVGTFDVTYKGWTAFWTIIPMVKRTYDISDDVNEQVAKAGGDAVVGLDVQSSQCAWNYWTFIGILPGCGNMHLRGDIIKITQ